MASYSERDSGAEARCYRKSPWFATAEQFLLVDMFLKRLVSRPKPHAPGLEIFGVRVFIGLRRDNGSYAILNDKGLVC
jgi:hypothetical protein